MINSNVQIISLYKSKSNGQLCLNYLIEYFLILLHTGKCAVHVCHGITNFLIGFC